jgi:hypothetical protein
MESPSGGLESHFGALVVYSGIVETHSGAAEDCPSGDTLLTLFGLGKVKANLADDDIKLWKNFYIFLYTLF